MSETAQTETFPPLSPWVAANRDRIGIGLQVVAHADDPAPGERLLAAGLLAEQLGFEGFYLGDHPGVAPDCWLHLAVIASQTRRIRLGSVVICNGYRHPVMTARLAADLDRLSHGRFILGLGIGWQAAEFAQLGLPFDPVPKRQAALTEAIAIVRGVWGDTPFTFHGTHYQAEAARILPPPVQRPAPPLMIAGGGERVTLAQVARHADACNFGPGQATGAVDSPAAVRHKLGVLRDHCAAIGRPFDAILRTHFTSWVILAPTESEATAKLARYYPAGLSDYHRRTRIVGSPDQIVTYYQALADAGIQYFVIQTQDAADVETIHLLATEVMPRLRPSSATSP